MEEELQRLRQENAQLHAELASKTAAFETLQKELVAEKKRTAEVMIAAEVEEEAITNRLMRRLAELKADKERLLVQVEEEEEYLTNTLGKKLAQLRLEKVELENQLEAEQEQLVNRVNRQLSGLEDEKRELEQRVSDLTSQKEEEDAAAAAAAASQDQPASSASSAPNTDDSAVVTTLKARIAGLEQENFLLLQKLRREQERASHMTKDMVDLEHLVEQDLDRRVNSGSASASPVARRRAVAGSAGSRASAGGNAASLAASSGPTPIVVRPRPASAKVHSPITGARDGDETEAA